MVVVVCILCCVVVVCSLPGDVWWCVAVGCGRVW